MWRASDESSRIRHLVTGVVSEVSDAVIATDLQLHIRCWNLAAERLYGWAEGEVLGLHIDDVVPWIPSQGATEAPEMAMQKAGRWHGIGHQVTRDGVLLTIHASASTVTGDIGCPVRVSSRQPGGRRRRRARHRTTPMPSARRRSSRDSIADEFVVHYQPVVAFRNTAR